MRTIITILWLSVPLACNDEHNPPPPIDYARDDTSTGLESSSSDDGTSGDEPCDQGTTT